MKNTALALFVAALLAAPRVAGTTPSPIGEDFEHGVPQTWVTEGLGQQADKGKVEDNEEAGGNHFLRISTDGTFYSFGIDTPFEPENYPILTWRWRIDRMPTGADISKRGGNDAGARLFVVFRDAKADKSTTRKLEYVWDSDHPVGTIIPDPYSPDTVKAIVLESGTAKLGQWVHEEVNLAKDFQRAFGEKAPRVKTIAFAANSNETHSIAISDFDDLQISSAK